MKKEEYIEIKNLSISENLYKFVNNELLPGSKISTTRFWNDFSISVHELAKKNKELLEIREDLQKRIDDFHKKRKGIFNVKEYQKFLYKINYIKKQGPKFKIKTKDIDEEISKVCAPQLVCPISNSRFLLNAANARWVSLYDSLYGTDIIQSEESASERYDPERAQEVIKYTKKFLDKHFTLTKDSWSNVNKIEVNKNQLIVSSYKYKNKLKNKKKFVGYRGDKDKPRAIILKNNNLHVEIIINPSAFSAKSDAAGISDIIMESALTTICDNEDSVAAVDAEDKINCYRNWLELIKGNLNSEFIKNGKKYKRKLNPDRKYYSASGKQLKLHGRSLLLNRNVGHLMTNPSILLKDGSEIPEGIMDAFITSAACIHDIKSKKNSRKGSIYIVKPKMHGPEEASFTNLIFSKVEEVLKLKKYTIKCGIMDEERRTSVNLKECIRALKNRVFFINTGFLDRTGDEIHTSMEAGPMIKKEEMKKTKWISAYENNNVDVGLECGFSGIAQIGKGMWAMPDKMADMMKQKISHLESGANCAWVPSPTAAGLHSLHYHEINVIKKQSELKKRKPAKELDLITIPISDRVNWSLEEINDEISNSAQTILGYVVRWIDQGVGCSKVPDINNIGLMEDRATLRISSQQIANWLHHGVCSKKRVLEIMKKMAKVVDKQNENDSKYEQMSPNFEKSIAFKAACELIFHGRKQPSGYTEPLLHFNRLLKKN
tara:strand:+ start:3108 stop:5258 length:2151 start_codon:yes stop_codon:yes gene_type:complete